MGIRIAFLITILINSGLSSAQQVIFGINNYIEYQVGTLPIVISVSHGGNIEPYTIPNRACNNPVYATDVFTIETVLEIKNALYAKTGCFPHIIICHLKRNKLDCNRNIAEGACGNPEAETAWNEFHNFIETARMTANQEYNNNTFFVDLHGHGNPIQRIELGYLLYDNELELPDNILNTNQYLNYSSIKNLALNNIQNYTHAELLRGHKSFGTLLSNQNYPSVPSKSIPFPGTTTNYLSGGYITANHTCFASGVEINGLQMELNYTGVRDTPLNRAQFATAFVETIIEYLNAHFNVIWNSCTPLSVDDSVLGDKIIMYPNPIQKGEFINFNNFGNKTFTYSIYTLFGQILKMGKLSQWENTINTNNFTSGIYFINLTDRQSENRIIIKLIIN